MGTGMDTSTGMGTGTGMGTTARPSTALDPAEVARFRDWLRDTPAGLAWLTGWPGSGMTSMVAAAVAGMETVWLTPATLASRAFLTSVCSHPLAVSGKRKVLVLDELEVVLGNESAMADVQFLAKHNARVPVVCVLKATRTARNNELRKRASLALDFSPPTHGAMVEAVTRVARAEGLACDHVESLCRQVPGDIRHVLETLRASGTVARTPIMHTADAVEELLGATCTLEDSLRAYTADAGGVPAGLFETYWRTTDDVSACLAFTEMASCADVVNECIHARQRWDLWDVHGALSTASAAVTLPKRRGVRLEKYGTQWNKRYAQCSKVKTLRKIAADRGGLGLCALPATELALVRAMVLARLPDWRGVAETCRSVGLDAGGCLHLMRLWDTGYKLSSHAHVKKALATAAAG